MNSVFADTSYFIALASPSDRFHASALQATRVRRGPLITTAWILAELGNAFSQRHLRRRFTEIFDRLQNDSTVQIVPADQVLFERGVDLFRARQDQQWSLTDCISFVVMKDHGITDALTTDHHFEQAGFNVLLK